MIHAINAMLEVSDYLFKLLNNIMNNQTITLHQLIPAQSMASQLHTR